MRKGVLQLARRLSGQVCGSSASFGPAAASLTCLNSIVSQGLPAGPAEQLAATASAIGAGTPWRPFASAAAEAAATEAYDVGHTEAFHEGSRPVQRSRKPRHSQGWGQAAPPDSDLGRLAACDSVDAMRGWRSALEGEGRFDADLLAALVRALCLQQVAGPRQRYLQELLAEAADGRVPVNSKAAAYLLWGPTKVNMRGSHPEVQRVLPIVLEHAEAMQSNDLTTTLWACGMLGLQLEDEVKEQLVARLNELLPQMKVKELTAAGTGLSRLGVPAEQAAPLLEAFEAKVAAQPDLPVFPLQRVIKLLPHLPGLDASNPLCDMVLDMAVHKAHRLDLHALADAVWGAGSLQYRLSDDDLAVLLACAQAKLEENNGVQVQQLLHGLSMLRCRAGQGAVSHELLAECAESQVEALNRRGAGPRRAGSVIKALLSFSELRAIVPEDLLHRLLDMLEQTGLDNIDKPWRVQMAFRRLRFQPGVDAFEPFTHHEEALQRRPPRREQEDGQDDE